MCSYWVSWGWSKYLLTVAVWPTYLVLALNMKLFLYAAAVDYWWCVVLVYYGLKSDVVCIKNEFLSVVTVFLNSSLILSAWWEILRLLGEKYLYSLLVSSFVKSLLVGVEGFWMVCLILSVDKTSLLVVVSKFAGYKEKGIYHVSCVLLKLSCCKVGLRF